MYLEISGRQSGKTDRLLDHALNYLNFQERLKTIIIVSYNSNMCENIRHKINKKTGDCKGYEDRGDLILISQAKIIEFFDDPDNDIDNYIVMYDEFDSMIYDNVITHHEGYYVTTPRRMRDINEFKNPHMYPHDPLVELVKLKLGEYESHRSGRMIFDYMHQLPDFDYIREAFGTWLTVGEMK